MLKPMRNWNLYNGHHHVTFGLKHSRLQSSPLLRMTDGGKALGNPGDESSSDWLTVVTIKMALIGQPGTQEKLKLRVRVFLGG